jgi:hypothetical protein
VPGIVELRQKLHGLSENAREGQAQDAGRDKDYDECDNGYQKFETFLYNNTYQQAYDERQNNRDEPSDVFGGIDIVLPKF